VARRVRAVRARPTRLPELNETISAARDAGRDPGAITRLYNVMGRITTEDRDPFHGPVGRWVDTLTTLRAESQMNVFVFWPSGDRERQSRVSPSRSCPPSARRSAPAPEPGGRARRGDKDLIIRGGYNVYPRDVEDVLLRHPDVLAAAVVGRPDHKYGEEVVAFVQLREGGMARPEEDWFRRPAQAVPGDGPTFWLVALPRRRGGDLPWAACPPSRILEVLAMVRGLTGGSTGCPPRCAVLEMRQQWRQQSELTWVPRIP